MRKRMKNRKSLGKGLPVMVTAIARMLFFVLYTEWSVPQHGLDCFCRTHPLNMHKHTY